MAFFRCGRAEHEFRVMSRSVRICKKRIGPTLIESEVKEKLAEEVGER
jgi:hypothetical protein